MPTAVQSHEGTGRSARWPIAYCGAPAFSNGVGHAGSIRIVQANQFQEFAVDVVLCG